jgi:3-methyladenine DNA glycosylase/8-oxoguanine DNA glycosylase
VSATALATRTIVPPHPIDLARSLAPLHRGDGDPTMRISAREVARAIRTPEGPASLHLVHEGHRVVATAWGPGAGWALETAPDAIGCSDDDSGFAPRDPLVQQLRARFPGVHVTRTRRLLEALLPVILEQKVTGIEARRAWRRMVRAFGEPAPGPLELVLPPDPARLAASPYEVFHPFGVERRRAETIRMVCARASTIETLVDVPPSEARSTLELLPGLGRWTSAKVAEIALGDPDAVAVGDFHLKDIVSWALAAEPRGTDERMLELLEPYRGHRGRVTRLLKLGGPSPPAFGPRMAPRSIEQL